MIGQVIQLLMTGLSLWQNKEARKYIDKVIKLKQEYHDEMAKPETERSDAVLDDIDFQLRTLSIAFCSSASGENSKNSSPLPEPGIPV